MEITGFEILRETGKSGAIQLFEAKQLSLDRIVTLKVLEPKFSSNVGEVKDFVHQARAVANFKHPNVVEIYDIGEENGIFYVAVEHIVGKTIRELVDASGPMPFRRAIKVAQQVSEALHVARQKAQLIHKTVSPDNILITDEGWVKISGFGQALPTDTRTLEAFIKAGLLSGNTHFMSPEQAHDEVNLTVHTDIYSMGATIYYMLTGEEPFHKYKGIDALKRHISDKLPHPRDVVRTIPASMALVLIKMMMRAPGDRYANWESALEDMNKVAHGKLVKVEPGWEERSTISGIAKPKGMASDTKVDALPSDIIPVPSWIRIPVWTLLIMWWILLAACLFREEITGMMGVDAIGEMTR